MLGISVRKCGACIMIITTKCTTHIIYAVGYAERPHDSGTKIIPIGLKLKCKIDHTHSHSLIILKERKKQNKT